jgi:FKBP-type peptidyl-prolyl cis-trans isomerase
MIAMALRPAKRGKRNTVAALLTMVLAATVLVGCNGSNAKTPEAVAAKVGFEHEKATKLPSGVEYVVLASGAEGGELPTLRDDVRVHYEGRLLDGVVFDSSYERGEPAKFGVSGLIPGWIEVLQLMRKGDKWQVYIPAELAYGSMGSPPNIGPDAPLVFTMEIIEVLKAPPPRQSDAAAWAKYYPWNSANEGVKSTGSGLEYVVLKSGDAANPMARKQDTVVVYYEGRLDDGTVFDSAYQRQEPAIFPAGRLIPGWVEALQLMRAGDHWIIRVPSTIAYGTAGAGEVIPPNADLTFEVELLDVLRVE